MNMLHNIAVSLKETAGQWQEGLGRWSGDPGRQERGLRLQVLARADRHLAALQRQPEAHTPKRHLVLAGR